MEKEKGFSIIICTHNGRGKLEQTLAHVARLVIPDECAVELIVVDNASTDGTALLVQEIWLKLKNPFPLRLLLENRPGKGYAVETGYDAAIYSFIVTADDDNWLAKDYLLNAKEVFQSNPTVGIVQGFSWGVFEKEPPKWLHDLKQYFIIGSPVKNPGFFPENDFFVWGAGMIIRKEEWQYLRSMGYSALTSKLPGKAAGEDNEVAIAILMLGKKIYYSDKLHYQHFMPSSRITWNALKKNFETFGYVRYYLFLYALALDTYYQGYELTEDVLTRSFRKAWVGRMKSFTLRQHLSYWLRPQEEFYQLRLAQYYSLYKWYKRLRKYAMNDLIFLQSWMKPILQTHQGNFKMPLAV